MSSLKSPHQLTASKVVWKHYLYHHGIVCDLSTRPMGWEMYALAPSLKLRALQERVAAPENVVPLPPSPDGLTEGVMQ